MADEYKQFFSDNLDKLKETQPVAYQASETLASMLGLEIAQTFAVNSITEISTYCTSIVARTEQGLITHVRNLDFKPVDKMKHLIYE